jgi:cytochrome c oxidase subunit 4
MSLKSEEHHIIPLKSFIGVFFALLFLTVLTVVAAQFNMGEWNTVVAMLIASIKAFFVLAYFMHLKVDDKVFLVCFLLAVFFLIVMYAFSVVDIYTRVGVSNIL